MSNPPSPTSPSLSLIKHDVESSVSLTTTQQQHQEEELQAQTQTPSDNNNHNNYNNNNDNILIDPITSLQDSIDGLSLAMFEALRGLRDAVSPESGNLLIQSNQNNNNQNQNRNINTNDVDELWYEYNQYNPIIIESMKSYINEYQETKMKSSSNTNKKQSQQRSSSLLKRDEFLKLYKQMEHDKDYILVQKLANDVIQKSLQIDIALDDDDNNDVNEVNNENNIKRIIPGMNRTKNEQLLYIESLIQQNHIASNELQQMYHIVQEKQKQCRIHINSNTSQLLNINEE